MDELGPYFAVLYPTVVCRGPRSAYDDTRRATCRAFNVLTADAFRDFADRITPAACIPVHTPEEAIEELEHCTRQLGFKVAMFGSLVARPVDAIAIADAEAARFVAWYDTLGLDSEHDYAPLWARSAEP